MIERNVGSLPKGREQIILVNGRRWHFLGEVPSLKVQVQILRERAAERHKSDRRERLEKAEASIAEKACGVQFYFESSPRSRLLERMARRLRQAP